MKPFKTTPDGVYHLHDFLRFHDKDFVHAAYAAVMKRIPNPDEEQSCLSEIRNGVSRERILGKLAETGEARVNGIMIQGLRFAVGLEKLKNVPVLGTLLICMHFICSSRRVFKRIRALENRLYRIEAELECSNERLAANRQLLSEISSRHGLLNSQGHDLDNLIVSLPVSLRKITRDVAEIKSHLTDVAQAKGVGREDNGS